MQLPPQIQNLSTEEIAELLEKQGQKVPASLVGELRLFIDEINRIKNGYGDGEILRELEPAA